MNRQPRDFKNTNELKTECQNSNHRVRSPGTMTNTTYANQRIAKKPKTFLHDTFLFDRKEQIN